MGVGIEKTKKMQKKLVKILLVKSTSWIINFLSFLSVLLLGCVGVGIEKTKKNAKKTS